MNKCNNTSGFLILKHYCIKPSFNHIIYSNEKFRFLILKHYCIKPSFNHIIYSNEKFLSVGLLSADVTNYFLKIIRMYVLTVLNVQMNEKKKLFKNKFFCDIHVQGAQDIRSSAKYTKFFYFLTKKLPLYENHQKSSIWYI